MTDIGTLTCASCKTGFEKYSVTIDQASDCAISVKGNLLIGCYGSKYDTTTWSLNVPHNWNNYDSICDNCMDKLVDEHKAVELL